MKKRSQIFILICSVKPETAAERHVKRGLSDKMREYFHGDERVNAARKGIKLPIEEYSKPDLDLATFEIDTTDNYKPSIEELKRIVFDNV